MKTKTENILAVMNVLSWVAFIGLSIESGAILISYGVSVVNPVAAKNLFKGLSLYNLRQFDLWYYTVMVALMVGVLALKSYIAYEVIKVLSRIKLANPFTMEVSGLLEKISYYILGLWMVALSFDAYTAWLSKKVTGLPENWVSGDSIFLAGIVFVIAQIFKKGVEIQSENELTV